jgi:hypothetical protein
MDRIARLRELEEIASGRDQDTSVMKWEAARLYWEEVDSGRSKADLARQIDKSAMHVTYMCRCWENFVVKPGIEWLGEPDYASLGSFYMAYNSDDVRGPQDGSASRRQSPAGKKGTGREDKEQEFSGHTLVVDIYTAASILAGNPGYWSALTGEDWTRIRETRKMLDKIGDGPD